MIKAQPTSSFEGVEDNLQFFMSFLETSESWGALSCRSTSISLNDLKVCNLFSFSLSPFLSSLKPLCFFLLFFSVPFPSILSLSSTLPSPCSPMSDSSIFFTLHDLLHFFHVIKSSVCQGTNCGSCMHRKPMLPVASDAHAFLSIMFGMCSNCQISWLTQIHPIISNTFCT